VDGNAAITAPLAGTADFTKAGPGTLVLSNSSPSFHGTVSINAGTLELQNGPGADAIGFIVGPNGILRHGYSSTPLYTASIVVNGGGLNSSNGLYLARGTDVAENSVTISTAPTTIRAYGASSAAATLSGGITGSLSVQSAASGSVIDSSVNLLPEDYGYTITVQSGASTATGDLVINGVISGGTYDGYPLVKDGAGSLRLNGANTFIGSMTVSAGTLQVDGSLGQTALTVGNTATLAGVGTFYYFGPTMQSGSTLAPGDNGIGTLTIYNFFDGTLDFPDALTLVSGSTTVMELTKSGSTLANDVVKILNGTLTYGGTLVVTNIGAGVLGAGDSFKLFDAPMYASSFSSQTLPALMSGLFWDSSQLAVNGTITVVGVNTTPTNLVASASGTNLTFSWPADHTGWRLLVQTNHLANGISANTNDWGTVSGSAGTNQISIPIDRTKQAEFYRLIYP